MDMYKLSKCLIVKPALFSMLAFSAYSASALDSPLSFVTHKPSFVTQNGIKTGLLGGGHNSWFGNFSNVSCLNSSGTEVTGGAGWVEFGSVLETEDVQERLNATLSFGVDYGAFSMDGKGRYLSETKSSNLSTVSHFLFEHTIKNQRFITDPSNPLSSAGQAALNQGMWNEVCGDQFISNRTMGGKLAVALKFSFSSEYFKKEFEAEIKGKYSGIAEASASVSSLSEATKQNTTLSIYAYQEGGKTYKLGQILGNHIDNSGVFASDDCNLGDISKCEKLIAGIVNYAQTSFVNDLEELPSPMKYGLSSYVTAGVSAPVQGPLPSDVADVREILHMLFDSQVEQLDELSHIYTFFEPRLSAAKLDQLEGDIEKVTGNINSLLFAAEACYTLDDFGDGSACVDGSADAITSLESVGSSSFDVPAQIVLDGYRIDHSGWGARTTCRAPDGHVVTGYGGSITGHRHIKSLHLQVRPVLQNGLLGSAHTVKCGTNANDGTEKMVILPEGYVMVGFAGHVVHTNFVGLTAYAKKYDSKSNRLVGPIETYTDGTSGAEMKYLPASNTNRAVTGIGLRVYKNNIRGYDIYSHEINVKD